MLYIDRRSRFLWAYALRSLALVLLIGVLLRLFLFSSYAISSTDMAPTLLSGDFVVALKWAKAQRGDVVVVPCSGESENLCLKRVLGVAGDRMEIRKGKMVLNGEEAQYEITGEGSSEIWREMRHPVILGDQDEEPVVVPPGHFYVATDNRGATSGVITSVASVEGKVVRIWLSLNWYKDNQVQPWPSVRWSRLLHSID